MRALVQKTLPLLCLGLLLATTGCSTYFRDRASDYRTAVDMPPLKMPEGQATRPIQPLYPIPAGAEAKFDPNKKFEAPKPKPLVLTSEQTAAQGASAPANAPKKPVLTQDGNGYPVISIEGEFNPIWDRLDEALRGASVKIDDRDQRVGMYYLNLPDADGKKTTYQLRVTRGQSAFTLALQKDDDTLAPQATTKTLFESIVSHWPPESGDMNGKARPAVYR